jgi:hypothetical protein
VTAPDGRIYLLGGDDIGFVEAVHVVAPTQPQHPFTSLGPPGNVFHGVVFVGWDSSQQFDDRDVVAGGTYTYQVRALDAAGNASATATTTITIP